MIKDAKIKSQVNRITVTFDIDTDNITWNFYSMTYEIHIAKIYSYLRTNIYHNIF